MPAPMMLPAQPRKKTVKGDPWARSARKLPNAITASDGNGGKKFSNAESPRIAAYKDPSGRSPSHPVIAWSIFLAIPFQSCHRNTGEAFLSPDPAHAFVGLPLDAHARRIDTKRRGQPRPDFVSMRTNSRRLGDDTDIHLIDRVPRAGHAANRRLEHSDGITVLV